MWRSRRDRLVEGIGSHSALRLPRVAPWGTIPSGKTVMGYFFDYGRSGSAASQQVETITLPAVAPADLTEDHMGFGDDGFNSTTRDPACTGSFAKPTAPRPGGCVCT